MIRKIQIVFALSMGVLAGVMLAQTDADFQGWMQGAVNANKALKGAIAAKDAATVTASAKTLEENFGKIGAFFGKRANGADAVAIAKGNQENAAKMGKAAAAGDFDAAAAAATAIGGSCNGCHMAHREGAKGGPYTIK